MRHAVIPITFALALAFTAGCDKSVYRGGGTASTPAATPFLLVSVSPPDGARGVEADAVVAACFSRPPDPALVTSLAFRLVDEELGAEVAADIVPAGAAGGAAATCYELRPKAPLALPGYAYRIELSPCIRAADGTALDTARSAVPCTSRFTTGALPDVDPPHFFFFAHKAAALSATAIALAWFPAFDREGGSTANELRYAVYQGTAPNDITYDRPAALTLPGALQCLVGGLAPNTEYFFVIRPRDEAGNEDDNTVVVSARTFLASETTELTLLYTADVSANLEPCG